MKKDEVNFFKIKWVRKKKLKFYKGCKSFLNMKNFVLIFFKKILKVARPLSQG